MSAPHARADALPLEGDDFDASAFNGAPVEQPPHPWGYEANALDGRHAKRPRGRPSKAERYFNPRPRPFAAAAVVFCRNVHQSDLTVAQERWKLRRQLQELLQQLDALAAPGDEK